MREFVVGGLLISPFIKFALFAAILFLPVRLVLVTLRFDKWVWHPFLVEAIVYVLIQHTHQDDRKGSKCQVEPDNVAVVENVLTVEVGVNLVPEETKGPDNVLRLSQHLS